MRRTLRRVVASLLSLGVIASLVVSAPIAHAERRDDADRVDQAIAYVSSQQRPNGSIPAFSPIGSTADAVLAFVAAGIGEDQLTDALGFLRRRVAHGKADSVGLQAKIVTAVVAAGGDPRSFGGEDLVQAIVDSLGAHGRFDKAAVFDDALAVIALVAAGETVPDVAVQWLVDAQCADGGWQYNKPASANDDEHCHNTLRPTKDFFDSDTNTTSYVVQAIEAAGGATFTADPFAFFDEIRDDQRHGWGYTWGFETTDANSTALAIQAYSGRGHAGSGRRARRAPQAAEPHVRRLVVHVGGLAADGPRSRLDDRGDPRSAAATATPGAGRGSRLGRAGSRLRIAVMQTGRVRSLTIALAVVLGASAPVLVAPGIACAAAVSGGPHAALVVETGARATSYCVALDRASVSGTRLIELASAQYGLSYRLGFGGRAVCMLDGVGATGNDCFGSYPNFWGYFHGAGASGWAWASGSAADHLVSDGDREGWSWGAGDSGTSHGAPPATSIDDACGAATTPDPSPSPPPSPSPSATPPSPSPSVGGGSSNDGGSNGGWLERRRLERGRRGKRSDLRTHEVPRTVGVSVPHGGRADVRLPRRGPRGRRVPAALQRTAARRPRWRSARSSSWV